MRDIDLKTLRLRVAVCDHIPPSDAGATPRSAMFPPSFDAPQPAARRLVEHLAERADDALAA